MSTLLNINSPDSPALDSATHQPNPVALKTTKSILTVEEIQKLLPHRYPFCLVDRIVEYLPGKRAVGNIFIKYHELKLYLLHQVCTKSLLTKPFNENIKKFISYY